MGVLQVLPEGCLVFISPSTQGAINIFNNMNSSSVVVQMSFVSKLLSALIARNIVGDIFHSLVN